MEKLTKTAKTLDTVCCVLWWLCVAAAAGAVLFGCVTLLAPGVVRGSTFTLNIDGTVYDLAALPVGHLRTVVLLWVAALGLTLACALYTLRTFRAMLACMKNGQPFDALVADNFHKLGVFTLVADVVSAILKAILAGVMTAQLAGGFSVSIRFDLTFLLAAGVLFLLAYIFRYGQQLQQQADETL